MNKYGLVVCFAMLGLVIYFAGAEKKANMKLQFMANAFVPYTVSNGKNYPLKYRGEYYPLYNQIAYETGIHKEWIFAGARKENIGKYFSHGIKKIPKEYIDTYPAEEWQPRAFARITVQELFAYVFDDKKRREEFCVAFGKRYCFNDKGYGKDMNKIYQQEVERNGK